MEDKYIPCLSQQLISTWPRSFFFNFLNFFLFFGKWWGWQTNPWKGSRHIGNHPSGFQRLLLAKAYSWYVAPFFESASAEFLQNNKHHHVTVLHLVLFSWCLSRGATFWCHFSHIGVIVHSYGDMLWEIGGRVYGNSVQKRWLGDLFAPLQN